MDNSRIQKLQKQLVNPVLIKKKENLYYLTGRSFDYRAEEYLLVTKKDVVGFGSGLEKMDWIKKSDRLKNLKNYIGRKQLGIEYGFTYGEGEYLKHKGVKAKPSRSPVDVMRQVKDADELAKIKKSMQIVERVFALVRKTIAKPGMSEEKLAGFIQSAGLKLGAEDVSFPAIVASGPNAAVPHHVPSSKKLKAGESIILDFGFKYKNYCSDFTRTVFLNSVPKNLEVAYNQVEKAYNGSMQFIGNPSHPPLNPTSLKLRRTFGKGRRKPQLQVPFLFKEGLGVVVKSGDVYQKAVDILAEKKLEKYFIHSLGHGTGLEIHELPNLSPGSKDVLSNNMVFSIEPGVYIPKVGGIRIEDLVYLKNGKVEKFINVSTKLKDNIF